MLYPTKRSRKSKLRGTVRTWHAGKKTETIRFGMACSDSISRKVDFNDLELLPKVEHPATAQLVVVRYSTPPHLNRDSHVDIDKLRTGDELMLESAEDLAEHLN